LKIIFTGSGTPLVDSAHLRAGASEVILIDDDALLFDCGRWVSMRLVESGIGIRAINYIFLTHHHNDHTIGLPLLISRPPHVGALNIFGPKGTKDLVKEGSRAFFAPPLSSREGFEKILTKDIKGGFIYETKSWKIKAANVTHIYKLGERALAYRIDSDQGSIVISGDVTAVPIDSTARTRSYSSNNDLRDLAKGTDVYVMDADIVHATPEEIGRAAKDSGAKIAVMTHIQNPGFRVPTPPNMSDTFKDLVQPDYDVFKRQISEFYSGEILIAEDLLTLEV
jgi:ribonuclease BN (tRNA processing enzyme)